jgi:hypothetical protein
VVVAAIVDALERLDLRDPVPAPAETAALEAARAKLMGE